MHPLSELEHPNLSEARWQWRCGWQHTASSSKHPLSSQVTEIPTGWQQHLHEVMLISVVSPILAARAASSWAAESCAALQVPGRRRLPEASLPTRSRDTVLLVVPTPHVAQDARPPACALKVVSAPYCIALHFALSAA